MDKLVVEHAFGCCRERVVLFAGELRRPVKGVHPGQVAHPGGGQACGHCGVAGEVGEHCDAGGCNLGEVHGLHDRRTKRRRKESARKLWITAAGC